MDYGYNDSPSQSPRQSVYTSGQYFDSTSEGSSPDSPRNASQMMFTGGPMQYEMYNYGATPANFFPSSNPNKIAVEYTGSSTLDERDRRRRRSGSNSTSSKEKDSLTNMHLRRRAQNRASQRAFRERKEKHVKGLEHQLEDLHEKHQDLLQSYSRQADEVSRLNARIMDLSSELGAMRSLQDSGSSFSEMLSLTQPDKFDKFDAFSSTRHAAGARGNSGGSGSGGGSETGMLYGGAEMCYFDKNAVDLEGEFALGGFEDSL